MDKGINRINVVFAEKGGIRETGECLMEGTKELINGWQNNWGVPLLPYQNGVPMTASQQWKRI